MAIDPISQESASQLETDGDFSSKEKNWSCISAPTTISDNANSSFDCNICLDSANDPVVTLCGHLYCWSCIYKWLHVRISSPEAEQIKKCPVCKADISLTALVPLYGRGSSYSEKPNPDLVIPKRPAGGVQNFAGAAMATAASPLSSLHPNRDVNFNEFRSFDPREYVPFPGEAFLTRMFGSPDANLFEYSRPYSVPVGGSGSPRMRRQEMQLDKSLNRVSLFLFCCLMLCLFLF